MTMVLSSASQTVGRYALVSYLGSGGMSDVYGALHTGLQKRVALKLLRPSLRHDAAAVQRFLREGECAARVRHPNVVDVSDVGVEDGVPYLVMELLEGETLAHRIARTGALSVEEAVDVMLPIMEAVAAAHAAGVLHRDIKPANILLSRATDGRVVPKLVDFGIAHMREQSAPEERALGTPHYMSPEQARGELLDEHSDQYAIASVLFELVTGQEPFTGDDPDAVLAAVASGVFPILSERAPALAGPLEQVLSRATAPNPADRYPSVSALAHALVPLASERMRASWLSGKDRAFVHPSPALGSARESYTPTIVVEASEAPNFSCTSMGRSLALSGRALVGAALLGLGVLGGLAAATPARSVSPPPAPVAPQGAREPREASPRLPSAPPHSMPLTPTVTLLPRSARAELDGEPIGRGSFARPQLDDGALHSLRVTAPGYVAQVVLFRGELRASTIALEKLRK